MLSRLLFLLLSWTFAIHLGHAQKLPGVKKPSLKVQINATSDTVILKFLRPSPNINLEGFILGYGSSFFSSQYIPLPVNGKTYDTELDAEPRYLITVRPSPVVNAKKTCSGQAKVQKPLHVVVGTLSPTSVFLAWGILINPQYDWTVLNNCPNDRFYTVRYREKEKNKKWHFQLCPNTETVIDNLKPNIIYEYGVKVNSDDGIWNKGVTHKTTVPPKHKGIVHAQSTIKEPKGHIQMAPDNTKVLVPVTIIKQVIQSVSIPKMSKSTEAPLLGTTPATERTDRESVTRTTTSPLETARATIAFFEEKLVPSSPQTPDGPKESTTESAPSSADQETTGPILSNALQLIGTTLAVNDTQPLLLISEASEEPEIPKATESETVTHQITEEPLTMITSTSPEQPKSTLVSIEPPLIPSQSETSTGPELKETKLVEHQTSEEPLILITSISPEQPKSTLVSTEPPLFSSQPETSTGPEFEETTHATHRMTPGALSTLTSSTTGQPKSALVSSEPELSAAPEMPASTPAQHQVTAEPLTVKTSVSTKPSISKLAATHQITQEPLKIKTFVPPQQPDSTPATHQMTQEPLKTETFISSEKHDTVPVTHQVTQEPVKTETFISPEQPDATPANHQVTPEPLTVKTSVSTEPPISKLATHQITQEPLKTKTFVPPEQPDSTPAKHQVTPEPLTVKTSVSSEPPVSKLATTHQITQEPLTTKTFVPPEQPDSTPAMHETTQEPLKTKSVTPREQPDSTPATDEMTPETLNPITFISPEQPNSTQAATHQITGEPLKTKTFPPPEQPYATPAKHQVTQEPLTTKTFISTLQPDSKRAKQQITQEPHKTKTLLSSQRPDTTTETRQMTQEPPADITFISPEQPDATPVSNEPTAFPFKDDASAALEIQESRPASTSRPIQESTPPKSSQTREQPKATLALNEIPKPKSSERPAIPQSIPVYRTSPQPLTTKPSPARKRPKATRVPKEPLPVPSKLDTTVRPDGPKTKPVPNEIHKFSPSKPKPPQTTERPLPTTAPKKTQWAPINLIQVHIFGDLNITSVPNETQKMPPSRPKPVHPTARPRSRAVPKSTNKSTRPAPINLIRLHIFDDSGVALVPNETQKTSSSKPTSQTADIPHVKPASIESLIDSIKSNISIPHRKPEPTQAPKRVHPSSSRPRTSARPRTRPVPYKTTPGTVRTKPSNDLNWISGRLTDQDITKLLGVSRNTSLEPNGTMKKAASGALPSVTQRVPLAPARPTHMRRRPMPPNSVTGRPGISGNGLMPRAPPSSIKYRARPTRIPIVERTQPPKEKPTSAPERETVTEPVFNDKPVSEVDSQGKPRYTAPHVKYIRKEDMVPCSITESVKHFPTEFATNQDEATNAPQNPPSNLTVVAVEGCSSFVILDWNKSDNETITEYKIISKENGGTTGNDESISTTNQTHSTVENLKPDTSYEFKVVASNPFGESPPSTTVTHNTESADPRVSELIAGGGKDAIWTEIKFKSDSYSECKGKQYVKRTWYKKFVGIQLCNSLRYKIYLSNSLLGRFYNIGDESGYGEDHCQFVDSFLDGRTGQRLLPEQLPSREGFYRAVRQQPVEFGKMGTQTHIRYVHWYECGTAIPGKW